MPYSRAMHTPTGDLARARARLAMLEAQLQPVRRERPHEAAERMDPTVCAARLQLLADRIGVILRQEGGE